MSPDQKVRENLRHRPTTPHDRQHTVDLGSGLCWSRWIQYLGSKFRLGMHIARVLRSLRPPGAPFIEPFVGAAAVTTWMKNPRICSDTNPDMIALLQAVQAGWIPPHDVTREDYEALKRGEIADPKMRAFIGFGCSFGGRWLAGWAKSSKQPNYAATASRSLRTKAQRLRGAQFLHKDYHEIRPRGALIYCDPPYRSTTSYGAVHQFDHDEFWRVVRIWSQTNVVVVSEYSAPGDFEEVASFEVKLKLQNSKSKKDRVEKLFRLREGFMDSQSTTSGLLRT